MRKEIRIERNLNLTEEDIRKKEAFLGASLGVKTLLGRSFNDNPNNKVIFYNNYRPNDSKNVELSRIKPLYNNYKDGVHIYKHENNTYEILLNPFKVLKYINEKDLRRITYPMEYYLGSRLYDREKSVWKITLNI